MTRTSYPKDPSLGRDVSQDKKVPLTQKIFASFLVHMDSAQTLCTCTETGSLIELPPEKPELDMIAWDDYDVDLNRLCKFACKYNYCPEDVCKAPDRDENEDPNSSENFNTSEIRLQLSKNCVIWKDSSYEHSEASKAQCKHTCQATLDQAAQEGRISNYGCIGFYPQHKSIPWSTDPGSKITIAPGKCFCDDGVINEIVGDVLEAMPAIAQVSPMISIAQGSISH
jgi:hypothetical protein